MWNVTTGQSLRKFRGHAARVNCVCFNEESTVILSGSVDCTVRIWDLRSRRNEPIQVWDNCVLSLLSLSFDVVVSYLRLFFQSFTCKGRTETPNPV